MSLAVIAVVKASALLPPSETAGVAPCDGRVSRATVAAEVAMPLWFELLTLGLTVLLVVAFFGGLVVLWVVRLRFPLSSVDARLTPQDEHEAKTLPAIVQPDFRLTIETQHPYPHQPRARLPEELSPPPGSIRPVMTAGKGRDSVPRPEAGRSRARPTS
jgi:hypothetical protein